MKVGRESKDWKRVPKAKSVREETVASCVTIFFSFYIFVKNLLC